MDAFRRKTLETLPLKKLWCDHCSNLEEQIMDNLETSFTLPGLARRLGLQYYQVEYLVKTGRIPDAALRTASNRKAWTAEQAEAIEKWFRDYQRINAGCCGQNGHGVAPKK